MTLKEHNNNTSQFFSFFFFKSSKCADCCFLSFGDLGEEAGEPCGEKAASLSLRSLIAFSICSFSFCLLASVCLNPLPTNMASDTDLASWAAAGQTARVG